MENQVRTPIENNGSLSESFKRYLDATSKNTILDPAYRKKKLKLWFIRTAITIVLYAIFWKYDWVKWSLVVTAPLSFFSLFIIVGSPYILKKKIDRTNKKIEETERLTRETPGE